MGSELGCFVGPSSSRPGVERVVVSNWGEFTPTTTGARTNTTATLTSTYVTCSTIGGPVQAAYISGPPPTGLTSVHPARQVFMPQPIKQSGSFPRALAGPVGILCPPVGNMEYIWGEASTRSNLRPEFDASQIASRPVDRAVDQWASGECYLSNGLVSNSVTVNRTEIYSQGSHGARPKTTMESQLMDSAGMEAGSTGVRLVSGASGQSSSPVEVSSNLQPPCPPSGVHVVHPPRTDVRSTGAPAQSPVTQGDQVVGHKWVRNPSSVSGLSSIPLTPDVGQDGFIAEARGTSDAIDVAQIASCVTGASTSSSGQPSQVSNASAESKSKRLLFKLDKYDISTSLDTYLWKFHQLADYMQWVNETSLLTCALA